jgi:hypothetical protein
LTQIDCIQNILDLVFNRIWQRADYSSAVIWYVRSDRCIGILFETSTLLPNILKVSRSATHGRSWNRGDGSRFDLGLHSMAQVRVSGLNLGKLRSCSHTGSLCHQRGLVEWQWEGSLLGYRPLSPGIHCCSPRLPHESLSPQNRMAQKAEAQFSAAWLDFRHVLCLIRALLGRGPNGANRIGFIYSSVRTESDVFFSAVNRLN